MAIFKTKPALQKPGRKRTFMEQDRNGADLFQRGEDLFDGFGSFLMECESQKKRFPEKILLSKGIGASSVYE